MSRREDRLYTSLQTSITFLERTVWETVLRDCLYIISFHFQDNTLKKTF